MMTFITFILLLVPVYWAVKKGYRVIKKTSRGELLEVIDHALDNFFLKYFPRMIRAIIRLAKKISSKVRSKSKQFVVRVCKKTFDFIETTLKVLTLPFWLPFKATNYLLIIIKGIILFKPTENRKGIMRRALKRKQERKRRRDDRIREFVGYFPRAIRWIPWLIISLCLLLLYPVRTFLDMMFFSLFFSHHRIIGSVEARDYKNDLKKQQKAANEQQAVNALIRAKHAQIEQDKASSLLAHELDLVREINDDFF